jgi:hypothetical protein
VEDALSSADNFFQASVSRNEPATAVEQLGGRYEVMRTNVRKSTVATACQNLIDRMLGLDHVKNIVELRPRLQRG